MSEIEDRAWEDQEVLTLLDELARPTRDDPQALVEGADRSCTALRRSCLEALGHLPLELDEEVPSAELKDRILNEILSNTDESGLRSEPEDRGPAAGATGGPTWVLPLAAALAIALVGVTGWQVWRVNQQTETIAHLSRQLEQARSEAEELVAARELLAETRTRLEMVTASAAEFCALKATQGSPNPEARGTLVMLEGRSDWFLKVEGLEPCKAGRQYKLWFVTDDRFVLGASFAVEADHESIEIRASGAPTGIRAVMITLEQPEVAAPSTPAVLYGDERMRIL